VAASRTVRLAHGRYSQGTHYFTPESKRASKQCKHTHSPPPKKSKSNFFSGEYYDCCVLGFKALSFTWTFSLVKKPSMRSTIQLSRMKK
jgi:hypothetical protein